MKKEKDNIEIQDAWNANKGMDGIATSPSHFKALTIDYDLYATYLEDSDLTEKQKREFIDTLWNIIVGFVDLGFGVHPLQQACDQNLDIAALSSFSPDNVIDSDNQHIKLFSRIVDHADNGNGDKPAERKPT